MEDVAAMGIAEVLTRLPQILAIKATLKAAIAERPQRGSSSTHWTCITRLDATRGPTVCSSIGYVSPQVWAWRAGRAQTMHEVLDQLFALTLSRPSSRRQAPHGSATRWSIASLSANRSTRGCLASPRLQKPETARMREPSSRPLTHSRPPAWTPAFSVVSGRPRLAARLDRPRDGRTRPQPGLRRPDQERHDRLVGGDGVPQVVAHRVHQLTHRLGRCCVQGIDYIAMPNILAKQPVALEYIQVLDPEVLSQAILSLPTTQAVDLQALGLVSERAAAARVWTAMEASRDRHRDPHLQRGRQHPHPL